MPSGHQMAPQDEVVSCGGPLAPSGICPASPNFQASCLSVVLPIKFISNMEGKFISKEAVKVFT